MNDELPDNVYYLDFYRRNWTVGFVYCAKCDLKFPHMWVTGASYIYCDTCKEKIPLVIDREL